MRAGQQVLQDAIRFHRDSMRIEGVVMRKLMGIVFAGLLLTTAVAAKADVFAVGAPGASPNDWNQEWNESYGSAGTFDTVDAFIETAGVTFASPGIAFGTSGWTDTDVDSMFSTATGPTTSFLDFTTDFTTDSSVPLTMDLYALLDGNVVDSTSATWDGSSWSYGAVQGISAEDTAPTPEPSSLMLLGTGFLGLVGVMRRKLS
jgi:hypothetical protein